MAVTKTENTVPFDFVLSLPRTAEAWCIFGLLPGTTTCITLVTEEGAAAPRVSALPLLQLADVVERTGVQKPVTSSSSQTSE